MDTTITGQQPAAAPLSPLQVVAAAPQVARYREAEHQLWMQTVGALPSERMVYLPQVGAHVRLLEHGHGPTLFFVHGGPSAAAKWAPLVQWLPEFRCVLLDRPGCGLSEQPVWRPQTVRSYATQLLDTTLATLDDAPTAIVASSFGGFAALAFASTHPTRVKRMIQLGCPALVPGATVPLPLLLPCLPLLGNLVRKLTPPTLEQTRQLFRVMGHPDALVASERLAPFFAWYTALMRETPTRANDQTLFGRIRPGDRLGRAELARLQVPIGLFWGAADPFGGSQVARALAATLPNAALELVAHSGHLPWLDAPEQAAAYIRSFV